MEAHLLLQKLPRRSRTYSSFSILPPKTSSTFQKEHEPSSPTSYKLPSIVCPKPQKQANKSLFCVQNLRNHKAMESPFFSSNPWNPYRYSYYHPRPQPRPQTQPQPTKPKVISIPVHFVNSDDRVTREPHPKPVRDPEAERMAAAMIIQRMTRGFLVRKNLRTVRKIEAEVEEIQQRIEAAQDLVRRDEKERLRLNEMLMRLLFRLDSVRGVRDYRKRVIRRVIALQEAVDSMAGSMEMGNGEEGETLGTPDRESLAMAAVHEGSERLEVDPMEETIKDNAEMKQGGEQEILGEGDLKEETTNAKSNLIEDTSGIKDLSREPMEETVRTEPKDKAIEKGDVAKDPLDETIDITKSLREGSEGSEGLEVDTMEETPELKDISEMKQGGEQEILGEGDLKEETTIAKSNLTEDTSGIKDLGEPMEETLRAEPGEKSTEIGGVTEDPLDETVETTELVQGGGESTRQPRETNNCGPDPIGETIETGGTMEKKASSSGSEGEAMKEAMERVAAESEKLRGLVAKLCERSEQQCMMMGGLAQRVENLERAVQRMEAARKKKKMKHRC